MMRLSAILLAVVILVFIVCGVYGATQRTGGEGYVHIRVESPSGAYRAMRARGVRGRIVVILSERLYFEGVPYNRLIPEAMDFPFAISRLSEEAERSLTDRNFAWVVLERGQARKVVHVMPRDVFSLKLEQARKTQGITVQQGRIDIPFFGALRSIVSVDSLPSTDEPVVLIADASFFSDRRALEEARALVNRVRPFLFISCPLEGDDTITDTQRDALREFVSMMEQRYG